MAVRLADKVPLCFEAVSGGFDRVAVEEFFQARREVLLDPKSEPLVPLSRLSKNVQARWREYLALEAEGQRPMNGVKAGSGKLSDRVIESGISIEAVKAKFADVVARGGHVGVSRSLQKAVAEADKPWIAAGMSERSYYRKLAADRKKAGEL